MSGSLQGQVALVTGCGRYAGIGRGIAQRLARAGADVVVSDVDLAGTRNAHERGEQDEASGWRGMPSLVEELEGVGARARAVVCDVGDIQAVDRMVAEAVATFGKIDIVVNNAAAPHGGDRNWTWLVSEQDFEAVMRVNTKGVFLVSSAVARHLLDRQSPGRIINIASAAGRRGLPQRAAYSASKFAVIGLTQVMAQELAPHGVTVNAICPGLVDTPRQSYTRPVSGDSPDLDTRSVAVPVGRVGRPDDIARVVEFLADPAADYITGQSIDVNGGGLMM